MLAVTLGSMRAEATALANMPACTATTAVTIAMANGWINRGINKLFRTALQAGGESVYRKDLMMTLSVPGQTIYQLPPDFYELKSVELLLSTNVPGDRIVLERFTLNERPYLLSATPGWNGEPFRYMLVGKTTQDGTDPGSIEFLPPPSSNTQINLIYIFGPKPLVNDSDTFDGFAGFDEYAVKFCTRDMLLRNREEERAQLFEQQLSMIQADVLSGMRQRDAAMAPRVNMTRDVWRPRFTRMGRFR